MSLEELVELMAAELKAVNDLNEKLAAMIEDMEVKREAKEADLDRGSIEHKAWYEINAEINAVKWTPDIQWHKDNGYPI